MPILHGIRKYFEDKKRDKGVAVEKVEKVGLDRHNRAKALHRSCFKHCGKPMMLVRVSRAYDDGMSEKYENLTWKSAVYRVCVVPRCKKQEFVFTEASRYSVYAKTGPVFVGEQRCD